jgi:hypothetical protein
MKPLGYLITDPEGKRFLLDALESIMPDDRFVILDFDTQVAQDIEDAMDNIERARISSSYATREDAEVYLETIKGYVGAALNQKVSLQDLVHYKDVHYRTLGEFIETAVVKEVRFAVS